MIILTIRTDREEAELGLYANNQQLSAIKWHAHRTLASTIHSKLQEMLDMSSISLDEVQGIVCFEGPGSFTGLRIGLSVVNAIAYANDIPVVASRGDNWAQAGIKNLLAGKNDKIAVPFYGAEPNITKPRK